SVRTAPPICRRRELTGSACFESVPTKVESSAVEEFFEPALFGRGLGGRRNDRQNALPLIATENAFVGIDELAAADEPGDFIGGQSLVHLDGAGKGLVSVHAARHGIQQKVIVAEQGGQDAKVLQGNIGGIGGVVLGERAFGGGANASGGADVAESREGL